MSFEILVQAAMLGLLQGGVYALIAAGLTLIYGVIKIVNFAHAEFVTLGMYMAAFSFNQLGILPYTALIPIVLAVFVLGALIERVCIRPAMRQPPINQMLITIGISTIMLGVMQLIWGADAQVVNVPFARSAVTVFDIRLTVVRLIAFSSAMVLAFAFWYFLKKHRIGLAIRAASQNPDAAQLMGIDTRFINSIVFGLGLALAALAGVLIAPSLSIYPNVGIDIYLLPAFVIVVLGTMGNFLGALIGGLIIGVAEGLGGYVLGSSLKQLVSLSIFIAILLLMPRGLFGGRQG